MNLVRVENLHVGYRRGAVPVLAVAGVDLQVERGETLALVGESGCGKSTLGRAILRLIQSEQGRIEFDGVDITHMGARALRPLRKRMQMVFQDPFSSLNPRRTVGMILQDPLLVHGIGDASTRGARVDELLVRVGLEPGHARRLPHEFSGGQRQRIGIARALALEPDFLVCDEPVSALDVSVRAQILNLLADIQAASGLAMLFISHDLAVVRYIADRVAVLYLGKIVESGPIEEVYASPRHPYTRALLSAVPSVDRIATGFAGTDTTGDLPSAAAPPAGCRFHTRCPMAAQRCQVEEPLLRVHGASQVACHFA